MDTFRLFLFNLG